MKGSISRKEFIKNSSVLLAGAGSGFATDRWPVTSSESNQDKGQSLVLKNVRLETGFEWAGQDVAATKTDLFSVECREGKFFKIGPNTNSAKAVDAKNHLMLPSFKDLHIHLDKTFYGGLWKARIRKNRTVKDMIAMEEEMLPEMLKTSTYRAEKMIELLQSKGTAFARSHVNIEPTSALQSLRNLQKALENKKQGFGAELVAFPQHGLYYRDSTSLMKEAAQSGIDFIGGLDPASIDGNINRTMDFTVQLALDYDKGIDIHLHEGGADGLQVVNYLIDRVNENPALKNRTWLSHCFVLASLDSNQQEAIAEKLAAAGIGIASTIPMGRSQMPLPTLLKHGVQVVTGNDSIIDHWNSFGTGSVLQKANLMAQLYGMVTELELSQSLSLATAGITPLNRKGEQQWPKPGDEASFVLIDASCSAEAVARVSTVRRLVYKGVMIY
ncbi:amidohydrolase [Flavihumibacter sp. UBA7668]|uniref:amidohydrolase n=1 Tax=Flavihumibacter sp. UBA7668 TaxID=1946542 RepID=UPI0025C43D43|nr:amidohydrolase [Flavihumibacter sp. UBA7668]